MFYDTFSRTKSSCLYLTLIFLSLHGTVLAEDNWPDYLGPNQNGHTQANNLPITWSETENVTFKTEIHDRGWSSPLIWGEQIWMTTATADGHKMYAVCVDKNTGKILHDIHLFDVEEPKEINSVNSYASPTVAIEEGRVYAYFGTYGIACLDTKSGKVLWKRRDLVLDHMEGPGSSPVIYEDLLIFHCDGTDVQYIIALNKRTGKTAWKTERSFPHYQDLIPPLRKAYSTPIFAQVEGKTQLISTGAQAAYGYEPITGEELWRVDFKKAWSVGGRPAVGGGLAYLATGYGGKSLLAIDPTGRGVITDTHVKWSIDRNVPNRSTPLYHDGLIYMVSDKTFATCLDAKTGEQIWMERLGREFDASPLFADGRIYLFDRDGETTVIEPGRTFKVLAKNQLDNGLMGSAAVSNNALFLRTEMHLYRIEK